MAKRNTKYLDTRTRIIIGGIGGIAPIIISLLVVDLRSLINDLQMMDAAGLGVRVTVLIFIGALVGYLHQDESEPFKVFQLGIAAPALLTTAINGYGVVGTGGGYKELKTANNQNNNWSLSIISSAHAAEPHSKYRYINSNSFQDPKVSDIERFLRGLIGRKISSKGDDWFVIAGSHPNEQRARNQVKKLKSKNYLAKIYQPVNGSKHYAVVIGSNLKLNAAQSLRKRAIKKGLPKDTYLWRH